MDDEHSHAREEHKKIIEERKRLSQALISANFDIVLRHSIEKALQERVEIINSSVANQFSGSKFDVSKVDGNASPPSPWILAALLPTKVSDDFIVNMEELYLTNWLPKYGRRKARFIWACQSIGMICNSWLSPLLGLVEKVKKITTTG